MAILLGLPAHMALPLQRSDVEESATGMIVHSHFSQPEYLLKILHHRGPKLGTKTISLLLLVVHLLVVIRTHLRSTLLAYRYAARLDCLYGLSTCAMSRVMITESCVSTL